MGKLSGLHDALMTLSVPQAVPVIEEPQPDPVLDALNALVTAVSDITIPEVKIDLNTAVGKLVKALSGIQFPDPVTPDFGPVVDAIKGITLTVEIPPEAEKPDPSPYTFTIVRNDSGIMTSVLAVPGIVEDAETETDETEYE